MEASESSPRATTLSGTIAGRFVILKLLGAGGMGQVYQAKDTKLKRIVAIKRMSPRLQQDESDRRRFLREAQQASALNHPNVAGIYDVIEEGGETFLVMEFVEGTPLRTTMQGHKSLSNEDFFRIAAQGLEGLSAAHEKGILHGDIKPENIMITPEGRVKVLDFGVARRFSMGTADEATLTAGTLNSLSGTPAYMAPEVLTQKPYDGRADVFSLGLVCYEMLGGKQPFETDSLAGTMASVLHTDPPPIEEINPKVSASVSSVIRTMLAKDPAQRYSSARDVLVDLRRVQQGEAPVFARGATAQKTNAHPRRAIVVVALLALLLAAGLFSSKMFRNAARGTASTPTQTAPEGPTTLAVLPFAPIEGNPKLTALGEGLVESVSVKLSRLTQDRPLEVIAARNLQERKITSLAEARSQFGATVGLIATLEQSGQLVRITYSLVNARGGATLGGDSITVPDKDAFGVEDDVAQGAVKTLQLKLRPEEQAALRVHGTDQSEAYKYYLQAQGYLLEYTKAENVANAIVMVGEALKLDPNFGQAKAALGEAYWRKYWLTKQKHWTQLAKTQCESAVALGNAGVAGHLCLGLVNDGTGQYGDAVTEFQRAIDLEPTNEDAYVGLALAFEHQGAINEAEKTYERAVSVRPNSTFAHNSLGTFYLRRNEDDKALLMFQKVISLAPEGYGAYVNLGATYTSMGRYADAIEPLKKSIAIRPSYAGYDTLGTAYIGLDRSADAARAYEEAIKLNPQQHVTWGNLGDARKYLGQKTEASSAYRKAAELASEELKVNPHDPDVLSSLATYYSNLGEREPAMTYLQKSLQYGNNDKDILLDAAAVYNNLGDAGVAVEWLGKAVQAGYASNRINDLPEFRNLRGNPGYQQLVARAQAQR
jgi:tetratricopeptide (TPR) repeat protein/tRNA A-37 threonylcarbamoyl transferase component Bud32